MQHLREQLKTPRSLGTPKLPPRSPHPGLRVPAHVPNSGDAAWVISAEKPSPSRTETARAATSTQTAGQLCHLPHVPRCPAGVPKPHRGGAGTHRWAQQQTRAARGQIGARGVHRRIKLVTTSATGDSHGQRTLWGWGSLGCRRSPARGVPSTHGPVVPASAAAKPGGTGLLCPPGAPPVLPAESWQGTGDTLPGAGCWETP